MSFASFSLLTANVGLSLSPPPTLSLTHTGLYTELNQGLGRGYLPDTLGTHSIELSTETVTWCCGSEKWKVKLKNLARYLKQVGDPACGCRPAPLGSSQWKQTATQDIGLPLTKGLQTNCSFPSLPLEVLTAPTNETPVMGCLPYSGHEVLGQHWSRERHLGNAVHRHTGK